MFKNDDMLLILSVMRCMLKKKKIKKYKFWKLMLKNTSLSYKHNKKTLAHKVYSFYQFL